MDNLSERIKTLRKSKGLTQLQLAEKLNVTDKAVSKWEVGEANPDLSTIVNIASLFNVSIDYLLVGKDVTISLDDMDAKKRILYIIKKDDVELLKKYTNIKCTLLAETSWDRNCDPNNAMYLSAIYENKSYNIFNFLLDGFLANNWKIDSRIISPASLVYGIHFEDFISFCLLNGRVDALEFIKFHYFAIGDRYNTSNNHQLYYGTITYLISEKLFESAFDKNIVNQNVIDYVGQVHFSNQRDNEMKRKNLYYSLNDYILFELYKTKQFNLLEKALNAYEKFNEYLIKTAKEYRSDNGLYYEFKGLLYIEKNSYFLSDMKIVDIAEPIVKSLNEAVKNLDIFWVRKFNELNKMLANGLGLKINILDDEIIKQIEIRSDDSVSDEEKTLASFTKYGILNYKELISSIISGYANLVNPSFCKLAIEKINKFNKEYISKRPVCFLEMIETWVKDKDYKKLYKFITDYNIQELEEPVLLASDEKIMEISSEIFGLPKKYLLKYQELKEKENALKNRLSKRGINNEDYRIKLIQEEILKLTFNINGRYKDMLNYQYSYINYKEFINCESYIKHFAIVKERYVNEIIKSIEEKLEELTKDKQFKTELDNIKKSISSDYLKDQLSKGNIENVIIKLCVKLEGILKYSYRYVGDLFSMLDLYIKNNLIIKKTHDCFDDEDNNYYFYMKEDERIREENKNTEHKISILNKLRKVRNKIVHAENNDCTMSVSEIEECIEVVENL